MTWIIALLALVLGWVAGWAHALLCERANDHEVLAQTYDLVRTVESMRKEIDGLRAPLPIPTRAPRMEEFLPCPQPLPPVIPMPSAVLGCE